MPSLSSTPKSHKSTKPKRDQLAKVTKPTKVARAEPVAPSEEPASAVMTLVAGAPAVESTKAVPPVASSPEVTPVEVVEPDPDLTIGGTTPVPVEVAAMTPEAAARTPSMVEAGPVPVVAGPVIAQLPIASIRIDGGTQSRAAHATQTIAEYAEAMSGGSEFPPVVVFVDPKASTWLADGFHRLHASIKLGRDRIACDVRQGSQRDAILFSVAANAAHGLRRTNADKRHAVEILLGDAKWSKKSDRWIADTCGVSPQTVTAHRGQLLKLSSSPTREGKDGKVRKLPAAKPKEPEGATAEPEEVATDSEPNAGAEYSTERRETAAAAERTTQHAEEAANDDAAEHVAVATTEPKWECSVCLTRWPRSVAACLECEAPAPASAPADDEDEPPDPDSALAHLQDEIERSMLAWTSSPGRFVATLEAWARRARDHFKMKEAANG